MTAARMLRGTALLGLLLALFFTRCSQLNSFDDLVLPSAGTAGLGATPTRGGAAGFSGEASGKSEGGAAGVAGAAGFRVP